MSNHHAKPLPARHKDRLPKILVSTAVVVAFISLFSYEHQRFNRPWPSVAARVLEARVVVIGTEDHAYRAGSVLYRAEAHVSYEVNGTHFELWLPASNIDSDKAYLQIWLSQKKSKLCIVHWNPNNPADIEAILN
jgi:hypothetical protein